MNTTVFNLSTLAVTEYTPAYTGLSGDIEALVDGVYRVGGNLDAATKIVSAFSFGLNTAEGSTKQQRPQYLYLHGTGLSGASTTIADGKGGSYLYTAQQVHDRATRFVLGKGIRDNYLKASVSFPGTTAVNLDRAEFMTADSANRRM